MSKKEKQLKAIRDNPKKSVKNMEYYENLKYPFVIERDEDGGYFIEYPDLPGCMTCGDNLEKAVELGEDAKNAWIYSALSNGDFIPEPKKAEDYPDNFKLRLPKSLYKSLSSHASAEGVSMNQYCLYLLSLGINAGSSAELKRP